MANGCAPSARIAILDDHPAIRFAVKTVISDSTHAVVWDVGTLAEARQLVDPGQFDLLITDITTEEGESYELIEEVRRKHPTAKIIIMSMHGLPHVIRAAQSSGANGYFHKLDDLDLLPGAIDEVLAGGFYLSGTAQKALEKGDTNGIQVAMPGAPLTRSEREVLDLLARGMTRLQIAESRKVEASTIETLLRRIAAKQGFTSRRELATFAVNARKGTPR